jgi:hypothetical protein
MKSIKKFTTLTLAATSIIGAAAWISPGIYQPSVENDFLKLLKKQTKEYTEKMPEDRVYLQLDKPFYEPGDAIWLSAFVRNGQTLKQSSQSEIVHVELISPKGTIEKKITLIAKNGVAQGDFQLTTEALGGLYKVKAYTNWQKNDGAEYGFTKEVQVQDIVLPNLKMKIDFEKKAYGSGDEVLVKLDINTNENKPLGNHKIKYVTTIDGKKIVEETAMTTIDGKKSIKIKLPDNLKTTDGLVNVMIDYNGNTESISRSIPIVLNNISLSFFPEGGDLVSGIQSNVAFKATNEFGKPADIEGEVLDSKGNPVAAFTSYHMGMGGFEFKPKEGEKYTAHITKPTGIKKDYELPNTLPKGFVLSTNNTVANELSINIESTENTEVSVVTQIRGKVYHATAYNVKQGKNSFVVSTYNFPVGVAQVTLFDGKGIARAERLTFVNKYKQLSVEIETDKDKYLPREKVKLTVSAYDEFGLPMPGNFALSVVNDQLLSFADDKSGNILSKMLLEQDLNEKVEEPGFYFDKKETKSTQALDYLLMTSGWRRFTWEKVTSGAIPSISFVNEKAVISGTVYDAYSMKPIADASIKINSNGAIYKTDANGKFIFNKIELYQPQSFTVSANNYYDQAQTVYQYGENAIFYLYSKSHNSYYYNYPSSTSTGGAKNMEMEMAPMDDGVVVQEENVRKEKSKNISPKKSAPNMVMIKKDKGDGNANQSEQPKKEEKNKDVKQKIVDNRFKSNDSGKSKSNALFGEVDEDVVVWNNGVQYYRTREFPTPNYEKQETVEERTDFRNTIYWNGNVELDKTGKKTVEFFNSDDISSFRTTVEGFGVDGSIGRTEKTYFTQLPVSMSIKAPVEVSTTDVLAIPLTIKNNTTKPVSGLLNITAPASFQALSSVGELHTLAPGKAKTIFLEYKVLNEIGMKDFDVSFKACGLSDAFSQKIKVVSKGFPVSMSFSGNDLKSEYDFNIGNSVDGSIKVMVNIFPSVVSDLLTGVEGILREPSGCFEQTSMSSYPNIMALDYMKTTGNEDTKTMDYANKLIDKGYKRLTTFETPEKGYEWFGASPGHEGLTAYGLMQFNDMKTVYDGVDQKMIDRTANWIMSKKNGSGGFTRNNKAYHSFGQISEEVMNGYIVYALAEAGYSDIKKELESSYKTAMQNKDPYQLAMLTNALIKMNDSRANDAMEKLVGTQKEDGSFAGTTHSITHSTGNSLTIETTSIAIMAMLKQGGKNIGALTKAVQFLVKSRTGYGVFGNTQGTVLALKALTQYAKQNKKTAESGTVEIYAGNKKIAERSYQAGDKGAIVFDSLGNYFSEGKNNIKIKFANTKNSLPHAVAVDFSTSLPNSSQECNVEIKTKLAAKTMFVGETVRLTTTLKNTQNQGLPSTMAIVGIPAGTTVQPWQLKELQDKKLIDYYEVMGNNIAIYFRGMSANELKTINLDLKAEMPGEYDAPASCGYLYYTNEYKCWSGVDKLIIKKPI